jgi:hypothetical protein
MRTAPPIELLRRLAHPRQAITWLLGVSLASAVGCDDDGACEGGWCYCGNSAPDCYLACYDEGCRLECSHTAHACGTVCGAHCQSTCHDTNDCSTFCGPDCNATCHHTASCGADCGERCVYSCSDTSRCGVRVGPGSQVTCSNVGSCVVECAGPCDVTCTNTSNRCEVSCAGEPATNLGDGAHSCG